MNSIFHMLSIVLLLASCSVHDSEFDYLIGEWVRTNGKEGTRTTEVWKKKGHNSYEASSLVLNGIDTVYKETCSIIKLGEHFYYTADVPENENVIKFRTTEYSNSGFHAVNALHDFPKEIKYAFTENKIRATISGNGREVEYIFIKNEI